MYLKMKAQTLKTLMSLMGTVLEEAKFTATKNYLQTISMDPSYIRMISVFVPKEVGDEWSCTEDETVMVDVDETRKIMNRSHLEEDVTIKTEEDIAMTIEFTRAESENKRKFRIIQPANLIDEKYTLPDLPLNATIKIDAAILKSAIEDVNIITDCIRFDCNKDGFTIKGEADIGTVEVIALLESYNFLEKGKSEYNIAYLTDVAKYFQGTITIKCGNDTPLTLLWDIGGIDIVFIVSPRVGD
jgi:hypothetical protein